MDDRDRWERQSDREKEGGKGVEGSSGKQRKNETKPFKPPTQNLFEDFCAKQSPVLYHGVLGVDPMTRYLLWIP